MFKKHIACFALAGALLISGGFAGTISQPALASSNAQKTYAKTRITLNAYTLELSKGDKFQLKLSGIKNKKVKWRSSKSSVASVKNGKVTAKKIGHATIIAKYKNHTSYCTVKVVKKPNNSQNTQKVCLHSWAPIYKTTFYWTCSHCDKQFTSKAAANTHWYQVLQLTGKYIKTTEHSNKEIIGYRCTKCGERE